jgi:hypothetical protein
VAVQITIQQDPEGALEITAYTDAPYSPDLADDLVARAVNTWRGAYAVIAVQELGEQP